MTKQMTKLKKSKSKTMGIKTIVVSNDETAFASFKNKSDTNIEKLVINKTNIVKMQNENSAFSINYDNILTDNKIKIEKKLNEVNVNNPNYVSQKSRQKKFVSGQDLLELKPELEKKYFNRTFKNDNFHIQVIHNIQDIKKILLPYVNDIVHTFITISRKGIKSKNGQKDIVGTLNGISSWKQFKNVDMYKKKYLNIQDLKNLNKRNKDIKNVENLIRKIKPYNYLFNNIFKFEKNNEEETEYNFGVLQILSFLRQFCSHSDIKFGTSNLSSIYNIEDVFDESDEENLNEKQKIPIVQILDDNFKTLISSVDNSFSETASNNLNLLQRIYGAKTEEEKNIILNKLYNFSIFKDDRNLGVNVRKIREAVIENHHAKIKNQEYDKIRQKINKLTDFVIWDYIKTNEELLFAMVDELRASENDEEKEKLYSDFAEKINEKFGNWFETIPDEIKDYFENQEKEKNNSKQHSKINMNEIKLRATTNVSMFSKLICFVTNFLDEKEINELLSDLINKFENIASFVEIGKGFNKNFEINSNSVDNFQIFNDSKKIANELRLVKNIGKRKVSFDTKDRKNSPQKELIIDALKILGCENSYDECKRLELNKNSTYKFLVNNVINSNRFVYIERNTNPESAYALLKNRKLISFAFSKISDSQILRYHKSIFEFEDEISVMKQHLLDMLFNVNYKGIQVEIDSTYHRTEKGQKPPKKTAEEQQKVQKNRTMIRLFLTVLYMIVKSMVKVNSRYAIAMSCFERDFELFNEKLGEKLKYDREPEFLVDYCLENHKLKKSHQKNYIEANLKSFKIINYQKDQKCLFKQTRDDIMHLNVIENMHRFNNTDKIERYFDFYHFVLQNLCFEKYNNLKEKFLPRDYKFLHYNKDFLHVVFIPLAYNIARYKTLTIGDLFDKDEESSKEENGK